MAVETNKTEQKARTLKWTDKQRRAAQLLAEGEVSEVELCKRIGIGRTTLFEWKQCSEFTARVQDTRNAIAAAVKTTGIAVMVNRVRAYQDRWERMQRIIVERGASEQMKDVPGGTTGLLVHNVKAVGSGEFAERVDLYEVDTGLLKEMREHEKQAAQELGQWTEKQEHTGANGQPIPVEVTAKFDYASYRDSFTAFARERICGPGDAPAAGNGN